MEPVPPGEAVSFSASQETPHSLWNPNVHFGVYKIPPPVAVVTQIHSTHSLTHAHSHTLTHTHTHTHIHTHIHNAHTHTHTHTLLSNFFESVSDFSYYF
jgi:hypothetical protein